MVEGRRSFGGIVWERGSVVSQRRASSGESREKENDQEL
jgi:hypothetical protein